VILSTLAVVALVGAIAYLWYLTPGPRDHV
jgi:hypothetical protein